MDLRKGSPAYGEWFGIELKALGWKPRSKFKTALKETIQWYIDNPSWWKPLKSGEFMKYYKKVLTRKK